MTSSQPMRLARTNMTKSLLSMVKMQMRITSPELVNISRIKIQSFKIWFQQDQHRDGKRRYHLRCRRDDHQGLQSAHERVCDRTLQGQPRTGLFLVQDAILAYAEKLKSRCNPRRSPRSVKCTRRESIRNLPISSRPKFAANSDLVSAYKHLCD